MIEKYRIEKSYYTKAWHVHVMVAGQWVNTLECRMWRWLAVRYVMNRAGKLALLTDRYESPHTGTVILVFEVFKDSFRRN